MRSPVGTSARVTDAVPPGPAAPGGRRPRRALLLAAHLLLGGCAVGPDFERPSPWSPASWFRATPDARAPVASIPVAGPVDPGWWRAFGDPELTRLMERVAAQNLDVRTATVRLEQSRAQRRVAGADQFPALNANASYTREKPSDKGAISALGGSLGGGNEATQANGLGGRNGGIAAAGGSSLPAFDLFQGGFDATWELDLWGRVRRQVEGAEAQIAASEAARRDALVSSLAEVARNYMQLRGTQDGLVIARRNLASAEESARLTSERFRGGLSTDLDVANARGQAEATAATIPPLEQQEQGLMNAIALLLGAPPGALAAELQDPRPVPPVPPLVPVGLPSDLARRRPDIREAEARLHAATADIGVAEADFFPRITLSGSFALQATQIKDLGWSAHTFGLGPSITMPIFEGGRLRATLDLRRRQQEEAAIAYQKSVLNAFHEVDNALTAYRAEQQRNERLRAQAAEVRRALSLANSRFRQGLSDYLEVLTAQRSVLDAEQQLASSTASVSSDLVALYKALGGGWESTYPEVAAAR